MAEQGNWPEGVKPLDVDGVGAVAMGTVLWAIAALVLLLMRDRLAESGAQWWISVALTGAGLGLPGLGYTTRRRAAYRRAAAGGTAASA
jgi:hypothetical protein